MQTLPISAELSTCRVIDRHDSQNCHITNPPSLSYGERTNQGQPVADRRHVSIHGDIHQSICLDTTIELLSIACYSGLPYHPGASSGCPDSSRRLKTPSRPLSRAMMRSSNSEIAVTGTTHTVFLAIIQDDPMVGTSTISTNLHFHFIFTHFYSLPCYFRVAKTYLIHRPDGRLAARMGMKSLLAI